MLFVYIITTKVNLVIYWFKNANHHLSCYPCLFSICSEMYQQRLLSSRATSSLHLALKPTQAVSGEALRERQGP